MYASNPGLFTDPEEKFIHYTLPDDPIVNTLFDDPLIKLNVLVAELYTTPNDPIN